MPIGKNSIKRVAAQATAPAAEQSAVTEAPVEKKAATIKSSAAQVKSRGKVGRPPEAQAAAPAKKKTESVKPASKVSAPKSVKKAKTPAKSADGFARIAIGGELPIHLL